MNRTRSGHDADRETSHAGTIIALIVALLIGFFSGYYEGQMREARTNAQALLDIKTSLLEASNTPRPVLIPRLGLEVEAWDKGVIVDVQEQGGDHAHYHLQGVGR